MKRKICVITGTRAEYGLLYPLMLRIREDSQLELQLIVTNMHLSPEFGLTYKEIEKDGFEIHKKIEILLSSDTEIGIAKSSGLAFIGLADAYSDLRPDLIVILGDRYEMLAAASVALFFKIPIAHLHGGEITEGAFDEAIRHSITKMSHLHFTSTEEYRRRVIQLGEQPDRVFNTGAIGIDNIKKLRLLSKKEFENAVSFKLNKRNLLVTFHPVTLERQTSKHQFENILNAIDSQKDTHIIFTKPNSDTGGRIIINLIDEYVEKNKRKAKSFVSMGQINYLSALQYVDAVVGNSSSGIVEAPSFRIGTIDIGDRQKGRIAPESVIHCDSTIEAIQNALTILFSEGFRNHLKTIVNPYGEGCVAKKIIKILKAYPLDNILKKKFYDIPAEMSQS